MSACGMHGVGSVLGEYRVKSVRRCMASVLRLSFLTLKNAIGSSWSGFEDGAGSIGRRVKCEGECPDGRRRNGLRWVEAVRSRLRS